MLGKFGTEHRNIGQAELGPTFPTSGKIRPTRANIGGADSLRADPKPDCRSTWRARPGCRATPFSDFRRTCPTPIGEYIVRRVSGSLHTCMHAYMYSIMHVCRYVRIHIRAHAGMYMCARSCVHACVHTCIHVCLQLRIHAFTYVLIVVPMYGGAVVYCLLVYAHSGIHVSCQLDYMYTYVHLHACMYTRMLACTHICLHVHV